MVPYRRYNHILFYHVYCICILYCSLGVGVWDNMGCIMNSSQFSCKNKGGLSLFHKSNIIVWAVLTNAQLPSTSILLS